jgi:hypothetical protein
MLLCCVWGGHACLGAGEWPLVESGIVRIRPDRIREGWKGEV